MSEWKEYKLKHLTTKIGSGATPTGGDNAYKSEGISLIRSQNVLDFQFSYNGLAFIDEEQAEALRNVTVQNGDVLLNITGDSVARVCKVPEKVLPARVNQHVAIIRTNKKNLDSDYLLYFLQAKKEYLLSISEIGATRRALTKGMLEDLDLIIPDLPEQHSIASILSSLDDKIDLLYRQNKTLEALAETLFRQWFVEEAEGLETKTLEELIVFDPREKISNSTEYSFFDMKCLSESSMMISEGIKRTINSGSSFRNGDILMAKITPCLENGKTAFVINLEEDEIGRGSTEFIVMRARDSISPYFVYCLARHIDFRNTAILSMTGTSGRQRVQTSVLKNYEIKYSKELMERYHQFSLPNFIKIKQNQLQIRTLTHLRDTLLPKLMSGEVSVFVEKPK